MAVDEAVHKSGDLLLEPCELFGFNAGQVQKVQGPTRKTCWCLTLTFVGLVH